MKDASDESKRLILEISTVRGLLLTLKDVIADDSILLKYLFHQIESLLKSLSSKVGIGSQQSAHKLSKILRWPLQKEEAKEILCLLDRQKVLLILALQHDQMCVLLFYCLIVSN